MTNAKFDERLAPASTARPDWRHLELQTEQPLFTDPQRRLRRRLQRVQCLGYMRESVATPTFRVQSAYNREGDEEDT